MVKLTTKYLFRRISKKNHLQPRKKDEPDLDYLKRVTHLYLQSQFIDKISSIPECESVSVIYLQNNLLRDIHNLENFPKLTHLYLQHNCIAKMENLSALTSLRKLYLGYNEISVVEGLENLTNLTELHLESQRLPQGETLYFDPLSLAQLKYSLKILNVSNNNLSSMQCLSGLRSLNKLIIENNEIKDIEDVMNTLSQLESLETLKSEGNPVSLDRKYLDAVVISSNSLKILNGKEIDDRTKVFIRNMAYSKGYRGNMTEYASKPMDSSESLPRPQKTSGSFQFGSNPSLRLGSKLFPILKAVADSRQTIAGTSFIPSKARTMGLKNTLNVSHISGSASYHL